MMLKKYFYHYIIAVALTLMLTTQADSRQIKRYFESPLKTITLKNSSGVEVLRQAYIELTINDNPVKLLLDTGCTFTLINPKLEKSLNYLDKRIVKDDVTYYINQDIQFDVGMSDYNIQYISKDTKKEHFFNTSFGDEKIFFDGLINPITSLMYHGLIIIDFDQNKIIGLKGHIKDSLYQKAFINIGIPEKNFSKHKVSKDFYDKFRIIIFDIDFHNYHTGKSEPYKFLLDTGSTDFVISKTFIEKTKTPLKNFRKSELVTVSATYEAVVAQGGNFSLGNKKFSDIDVVIDPKLDEQLPEVMGIIGMRNLQNAILVIPTDPSKPLLIGYRGNK